MLKDGHIIKGKNHTGNSPTTHRAQKIKETHYRSEVTIWWPADLFCVVYTPLSKTGVRCQHVKNMAISSGFTRGFEKSENLVTPGPLSVPTTGVNCSWCSPDCSSLHCSLSQLASRSFMIWPTSLGL